MDLSELMPQTERAARRSFAKISPVLEIPNLIQIQFSSFCWFQEQGLKELYQGLSIQDFSGVQKIIRWIPFFSPSAEFTISNFRKLKLLLKMTSLLRYVPRMKEMSYMNSLWVAETCRRIATDLIQPEVVALVKGDNYSQAFRYMEKAISLLENSQKIYQQMKLTKEAEDVSTVLSKFVEKRNELFEMNS